MKRIILILAITLLGLHCLDAGTPDVEGMVEELLGKLTLEQKLMLCYGDGVRYNNPIPEIGLPKLLMCAGPRGVAHYWTRGKEATAFPCGVGLAAAWDPSLAGRMAEAIAREGASLGVDVMLMPGLNINRDPLGGRTFERYTEDPYLNARLVVPQVRAVQETVGLASTITLFVANNQETERDDVDAVVSERALREIYFPAFKAGVIEGRAWALMTGSNKVNGEHVSSSRHLLTDVLKNEWGFDGVVMTDWCDAKSTVDDALAGLDLSMPGRRGNRFAEPLARAVREGKVPESVIEDKVRRLLRLAARVHRLPGQIHLIDSRPLLDPEHVRLAREIAEGGMVLLKNDGVLPFDPGKLKSVAVFGPNADYVHNMQRRGGGSSGVHCPEAEVTPLEGLRAFLGTDTAILWDPSYCALPVSGFEPLGGEFLQTALGQPGLKLEYFNNPELKGNPVLEGVDKELNHLWDMKSPDENIVNANRFSGRWSGYLIPPADGQYSFLVQFDDGVRITIDDEVVFPRWGSRGGFTGLQFSAVLKKGHKHKLLIEYRELEGDATLKVNWKRPFSGEQLAAQMQKVAALAKKAEACIFFAGLNNVIETEGHDRKDVNLTPHQAEMIQAVIRANPNTAIVVVSGAPVDLRGWGDEARAIFQAWYGGVEAGTAMANLLFGKVNPSGKLPITLPKRLEDNPAYREGGIPKDRNEYTEGIFVGYRWYDHQGIEPAHPFGHGLSYTTFAYSSLEVTRTDTGDSPVVHVSFGVKNTGVRAGAEVAQIYVADKEASVLRPPRELKGFAKVHLEPGETKPVSIELKADAFQFWDEKSKAWKLEPGAFEVQVGSSSRDIRLKKQIALE